MFNMKRNSLQYSTVDAVQDSTSSFESGISADDVSCLKNNSTNEEVTIQRPSGAKNNRQTPFNNFKAPLYPMTFTKLTFRLNKRACYSTEPKIYRRDSQTKTSTFTASECEQVARLNDQKTSILQDSKYKFPEISVEPQKCTSTVRSGLMTGRPKSHSTNNPMRTGFERHLPYRATVRMVLFEQARKVAFVWGSSPKTSPTNHSFLEKPCPKCSNFYHR